MKLGILALGMVVLSACGAPKTSATVKSGGFDTMRTIVSCKDTSGFDTGYRVVIRSGGIAGVTLAYVQKVSYVGAQTVLETGVTAQGGGMERVYVGQGFRLAIGLESVVATTNHHASLTVNSSRLHLTREMSCSLE